MRERRKKLLRQKAREEAVINFVSRQALEAILGPNLPETYKDATLDALFRIAEKRSG